MSGQKIMFEEVERGHDAFVKNEPRDLFYRAATELVSLALRNAVNLTVAEALAVLLQTWNRGYFRFQKPDKAEHFASMERLLTEYNGVIHEYRKRSIDTVDSGEQVKIANLFQKFEAVLGPVGAAKALHLLAPKFFPLWDRAIAKAHGVPLRKAGFNGDRYFRFIVETQAQHRELRRQQPEHDDLLKWLDEYNYCKYTMGWLR
jgi:hypothetical protein